MRSVALFLLPLLASATPSFVRVNEVELKHAAVASLDNYFPGGSPALILTTFFPFGEDGIYCVRNLSSAFRPGSSVQLSTNLDATAKWPNQALGVEKGTIFSAPSLFISADCQWVFCLPV